MPKAQARNRKQCEHAAGPSSSYRLGDVDVDDGGGAEGRRASVPGLDHQRPRAVLLLGDVLHDLHGLDEGLQHDLPSGDVDVKGVVGVGLHDGIFNDVVGRLGIVIHRL